MEIAVNNTEGFRFTTAFIEKLFRVISTVLPRFKRGIVSVAFVGNRTIRRLNARYRQKDAVTDVLSFPEMQQIRTVRRGQFLGEIIISYPRARSQARERGEAVSRELVRLLVHGFLHLVGYDHRGVRDARKMEAQEGRVIRLFERKK
ncbi:MAG: rRNA maturation RNase YbeY [Patescibacteria group bacterium]